MHKGFPDPSILTGTGEERLSFFRKLKDQIPKGIIEFLSAQK
jgi:hypothetical protein